MEQKPQRKSPTFIVVGGTIGAALLYAAWVLTTPAWFAGLAFYLGYEAWTFFNRYLHDTISDIIWKLNERPLVPYLFGAATVALIAYGIIPITEEGLYLATILGFLMGHFFFQAKRD